MSLHDFVPFAQLATIGFCIVTAWIQNERARFHEKKMAEMLASIVLFHEEAYHSGKDPELHAICLRRLGFAPPPSPRKSDAR